MATSAPSAERESMGQEADTEVVESEEIEEQADEELEIEAQADTEGDEDEPAEEADPPPESELQITIGDDPEPEPEEAAPNWVKDLRQRNRDLVRRNKELEQERVKPPTEAPQLGPEPSMSDEDVDYDADKFKAKWRTWSDKKQQADTKERERKDAEAKAGEAWGKTLDAYKMARTALKVPDFADAESIIVDSLSQIQQNIILAGAKDAASAAKIVYALGKSPARLKEVAAITDPVKFAFAIAEVQSQMKVTTRKPATAPEAGVRGGTPGAQGKSGKIDSLLKQAEKSGDYTAYFKASRALRKKK